MEETPADISSFMAVFSGQDAAIGEKKYENENIIKYVAPLSPLLLVHEPEGIRGRETGQVLVKNTQESCSQNN
jgi:hypothetical protein